MSELETQPPEEGFSGGRNTVASRRLFHSLSKYQDHCEEPTNELYREMQTSFETHGSCGRQLVTASFSDPRRKLVAT